MSTPSKRRLIRIAPINQIQFPKCSTPINTQAQNELNFTFSDFSMLDESPRLNDFVVNNQFTSTPTTPGGRFDLREFCRLQAAKLNTQKQLNDIDLKKNVVIKIKKKLNI